MDVLDILDVLEDLDGLVTDVISGVAINLSIKSPLAQKAGLFLFFFVRDPWPRLVELK